MTTPIPNFHLRMPGSNKLEIKAYGTGIVKICENDADFQDFSGCIDSFASTDLVPNSHQPTRHNIKYLLKLDIQVDF